MVSEVTFITNYWQTMDYGTGQQNIRITNKYNHIK